MNGDVIIWAIAIFMMFFVCWGSGQSTSQEEKNKLDEVAEGTLALIAFAESSNGLNKTGDNGRAIGTYQITQPVLDDYNDIHKTEYKLRDLYDDEISEKVARWHMFWLASLLQGKEYCPAKLAQAWNEGIGRAMSRPVPQQHKNLVYDALYRDYWRKKEEGQR